VAFQGLFNLNPWGIAIGIAQQAVSDSRRGADMSRTGNCPPGQYLAGRPPRCVGTVQAPYDPGPVAIPEPVFLPQPAEPLPEPSEPIPAFAPPLPVTPLEPLPLPAPLAPIPPEPLPLTPDPPMPTRQPTPSAPATPTRAAPTPEPWRGRPDFGKFDHLGTPTKNVGAFVKALRALSGPVGWLLEGITYSGGVGKPGRGEKYPRGQVLFPQVVTVPRVKVPNASPVRLPVGKNRPGRDFRTLPTLPEVIVTGQRPVPHPSPNRIARPVAHPALPTVVGRPVHPTRTPAKPAKPATRVATKPRIVTFKLDPLTLFKLLPQRSPRRVVQPLPTSPRTAVFPVEQPYAPPVESRPRQPLEQPFPAPTANPIPAPSDFPRPTRPFTPLNPTLLPYIPTQLDPMPLAQPQPRKTDRCNCVQQKDKGKKRKPRAPRAVCWVGTYRESAFGLSKTKREQVPCR